MGYGTIRDHEPGLSAVVCDDSSRSVGKEMGEAFWTPPPLYLSNSLNRPLLGSVHLSLVDTYRCAYIGQHPYSHLVQTVHTSRLLLDAEMIHTSTLLFGSRGAGHDLQHFLVFRV
jgi:hypothetical protein